mmetsp:Transcript_10282/g.22352  ORF Transcript_10282/g.22352 Transcript_10282/m.22352 type:complete len:156 (-) Transcript_10282:653-1120(-)
MVHWHSAAVSGQMLSLVLALALFIAIVVALATSVPTAALVVEEEPSDSADGSDEPTAGYLLAWWICTLMLPMMPLCQAPTSRVCRGAWRHARAALPSAGISITLLSGRVVRLHGQAAGLTYDQIKRAWNLISGARDAERRARHAQAREAREARHL